ncbi:hypothetical protein [Paraburkholderia phenoliruptrix]|uniref:Uncharacterized protein n=2 Tax=Paraburkholderia phenoliruptrix TaxID=252970 RepID=K0DVD4_9BURK|nr:hypothetical protein [Paraburkholderia phenoliruptrix]AFT90166.1 hypothetical protein BUPH_08254 [Paraburkholderia phenoliruptrix BR3459a]CAB4052548.1 hypothetical protein LMG9964_06238 [Paraburkholderia phenoliruptrix]
MYVNRNYLSAPSLLPILFTELDTKITYALSDASLLDATQWQDVDRRLNRLRAALAGSHCLHRAHNDDQPLQVSIPTDCLF